MVTISAWGVAWLTQVYGLSRVEAATTAAVDVRVGIAAAHRWAAGSRSLAEPPAAAFARLQRCRACWVPLRADRDLRLPAAWLPRSVRDGLAAGGFALVFSLCARVNDPARVASPWASATCRCSACSAPCSSISGVVLDARWRGLASTEFGSIRRMRIARSSRCASGSRPRGRWRRTLVSETRCRNVWGARPLSATR